jgi:hypothetical protein
VSAFPRGDERKKSSPSDNISYNRCLPSSSKIKTFPLGYPCTSSKPSRLLYVGNNTCGVWFGEQCRCAQGMHTVQCSACKRGRGCLASCSPCSPQLRLRFLPKGFLCKLERERGREPEPRRAGRGCRDRRGGARLFPFLPSSLPYCYYQDSTRILGSLAHTLSLSQCACRQEPDRGTSNSGKGWMDITTQQ